MLDRKKINHIFAKLNYSRLSSKAEVTTGVMDFRETMGLA